MAYWPTTIENARSDAARFGLSAAAARGIETEVADAMQSAQAEFDAAGLPAADITRALGRMHR